MGTRDGCLDKGYFLIHFRSKKNYDHVLNDGPWMIMGNYLIIAKWHPNFRLVYDQISSTLVQVCFL